MIGFIGRAEAYDRGAVTRYSYHWANASPGLQNGYNPQYTSYAQMIGTGLDCSNFVSQNLIAGNIVMVGPTNVTEGTITNVDILRLELQSHKSVTVTDITSSTNLPEMKVGDVLFGGENIHGFQWGWPPYQSIFDWNHSAIVTTVPPNGVPLYSAHSNNRFNREVTFFVDDYLNSSGGQVQVMTLPDAPIVKYLKIFNSDSGPVVYEWTYDDDYYPDPNDMLTEDRYRNTYTGLNPKLLSSPSAIGSEKLTFEILFDQKMDNNSYDFKLLAGNQNAFTISPVGSNNGWSTHFTGDDKWTGKIDLTGQQYGQYTLSIDASSYDGGDGSFIDRDGVLQTYDPGPNRTHRVFVGQTAVRDHA